MLPISNHQLHLTALNPGRTYTLTQGKDDSTSYYGLVRDLLDRFLEIVPDASTLRTIIQSASARGGRLKIFLGRDRLVKRILRELDSALAPFLSGVDEHLRNISLADRLDKTLRTTRQQYLLYMLEIELSNRINREGFSKAPWRMALIAHCLRDFRTGCQSRPGDTEHECTHCDSDCFVNMGSELLKRYRIHPYISVSMDHRRLFRLLKQAHPGMGVLGVACIPELVTGMRLCEGLGIPAVGIPLDANRCSRWLGECLETTMNLGELERLIKD